MGRPALRTALVLGISVGLALPVLASGAPFMHIVCTTGAPVGTSGVVNSPVGLFEAPPGGQLMYHFTWWRNWTVGGEWFSDSTASGTDVPVNNTSSIFVQSQWNLSAVSGELTWGFGSLEACPSHVLDRGYAMNTCVACPVLPAVPAGIGNRVEISSNTLQGFAGPWVVLNGSYTPVPAFDFNWSYGPRGLVYAASANTPQDVSFAPFYNGSVVVGLALEVNVPMAQFGVPIQLFSGGATVVPSSTPTEGPFSSGWFAHVSYIFPVATTQGEWSVYSPGEGSAFPLGGFAFVQTA